jgi:cell division transport system permease protein
MMEGVIEGFFGALVGIIVAVLVHSWFISKLEAAANNVRLVGGSYMVGLSLILIVIGIVIGAVGSAFALRRYIEV